MFSRKSAKNARLPSGRMLEILKSEPGRTSFYYAVVLDLDDNATSAALSGLERHGYARSERKPVTNPHDARPGKMGHKRNFWWPVIATELDLTQAMQSDDVAPFPGRSLAQIYHDAEDDDAKKFTRRRSVRVSYFGALMRAIFGVALYVKAETDK